MPSKSKEQEKLMMIAAKTRAGYGAVPQKVAKEFHQADVKAATSGKINRGKK